MELHFFGVRGSKPSSHSIVYGGNTCCVGMDLGDTLLLFDAGTGISETAKLGKKYKEIHLFISHYHWDHIMGLPSWEELYKDNVIHIYGHTDVDKFLGVLLALPYWPVGWSQIKAKIIFHTIQPYQKINIMQDVSIQTEPIEHPGGCLGYIISVDKYRIAYMTDMELNDMDMDQLSKTVAEVDILIVDSTWLRHMDDKIGWGHSNCDECVKLSELSKAKQLVLIHMDPEATDSELEKSEKSIRDKNPNAFYARQGLVIPLN